MDNISVIIAFVLYLGLMMAIGIYYYRKTNSMDDYIIGNRKLGAWVTAMSAEASDMSGWMMMGVPGAAYCAVIQKWPTIPLLCRTFSRTDLTIRVIFCGLYRPYLLLFSSLFIPALALSAAASYSVPFLVWIILQQC